MGNRRLFFCLRKRGGRRRKMKGKMKQSRFPKAALFQMEKIEEKRYVQSQSSWLWL